MVIDSVDSEPIVEQQKTTAGPIDEHAGKPTIELPQPLVAVFVVKPEQRGRCVVPVWSAVRVCEMFTCEDEHRISALRNDRIAVGVRALVADPPKIEAQFWYGVGAMRQAGLVLHAAQHPRQRRLPFFCVRASGYETNDSRHLP